MKRLYFLVFILGFLTTAKAQIINFPDLNFKSRLLQADSSNGIAKDLGGNYFKIDTNSNGEIEISEALNVSQLNLGSLNMSSQAYSDASGVENFTNLKILDVGSNNLTAINISGLSDLEDLNISRNQIATFDISNFSKLKNFTATLTGLKSIKLIGCTALEKLYVAYNELIELNLDGLSSLKYLDADWNQLTVISTVGLISMETFSCFHNNIASLDVSKMPKLNKLTCSKNQIGFLDVSGSPNLSNLYAYSNQLSSMNIKTGSFLSSPGLYFADNPKLEYICVDPGTGMFNQITTLLSQYGNTNCVVNSYCSFGPGGSIFSIAGNNRYDSDNNGCSIEDINFPNLKFSISNGVTTGTIISSKSGKYSIPLPRGYYTLTPIVENPSYFTVAPKSLSVDLYNQTNPVIQDFCITSPNSNHPDLSIYVCPLDIPRPGFNSGYKIIYQNVGTTLQSGTINLKFDDAILDFVSANTPVANQTENNISWNFTNMLPLERGEIIVIFNVNSPVEVPPVVSGTAIGYVATINSSLIDETPYNNIFYLNQIAVNSFDPNDKTCLEGATIPLSQVGKEVHYRIRFENTGTANAENIVVTDFINTSEFDINSLVPLDGSHPFRTRISNTNQVEFHFENINLPFDDANNDGYVLFKIKTKSTLGTGSTFSNTASIYFDYNAPIITNTATTVVAVLSNQDFEFEQYFNVYPNPVKEILNIETKEIIEVSSINVYNSLGQLVLVITNAGKLSKIDVSRLESGNYIIKLNTNRGIFQTKFIKN